MKSIIVAGIFLFCSTMTPVGVGVAQETPVKKVGYPNLNLVYRAAKAIETATSVGVNYSKFGDLLQNLATEVAIAEDKVTDAQEKVVLKQYKALLYIYQLSYKLWDDAASFWKDASKMALKANAYYLNDTKTIEKIKAEEAAYLKAKAASDAKEQAIWRQEVDKYIQGLPEERRESVRKECLELGPDFEVMYRKGDDVYHHDIRSCRGFPNDLVWATYYPDAQHIKLRQAITMAVRCPFCERPSKE